MKRRHFLQAAGWTLAGLTSPLATMAAQNKNKPNIVLILADDLGYGDVHCLNPKSTIPTPHFDRLAKEGVTFTDAHTGSAVCTPTRYGLLTGRYAWRTRLKSGVLNGFSPHLIDPKRLTIASLLKRAGYTTGCVGKWHLGLDYAWKDIDNKKVDTSKPIRYSPTANGFDYFFGIPASLDFPPYGYIENDRFIEPFDAKQERQRFPQFVRAGDRGTSFDYVKTLDVLLDKATNFVKTNAKKNHPFFLYFPFTAPHKPVAPAPRFQNKTRLGPYGDFVTQVDWTLGQMMKTIDDLGIKENTLFIFTSDNGSYMFRLDEEDKDHVDDNTIQGYKPQSHTSNYIFRGTKADIWEGGHHVPCIVRWPNVTTPSTTCNETICLTDIMATLADVIEEPLPENAAEDSFSFLPLIQGKSWPQPRPAVVHHSVNGTFAIRQGKWKLVLSNGSGGREKPSGKPWKKPYRLFDMEKDISEKQDLASQHPDKVEQLEALMKRFIDEGRSIKR